jgi:hypothetical protein
MIAVVVDADQVAELVEREFLQVADARRKHLDIRAVGVRAEHRPLIWKRHPPAASVDKAEADVANLPVQPPVRPDRDTGNSMPAKCRVGVVSDAHGSLGIDGAVAVLVAHAPDARRNAEEQVSPVVEQSAHDVEGGIRVETFGHDLGDVTDAISVRILDPDQAFFHLGQVPPVMGTVLVQIVDPHVLRAARRRELPLIELLEVVVGLQRVDERDP